MNQQQASTTPINLRNEWKTPDWLYNWRNSVRNFQVDLACTQANKKCEFGLAAPHIDSLKETWSNLAERGFCNPPYDNTKPWIEKGYKEAQEGFLSEFVVPMPNGETVYRDWVFGKASEIIFINGRVGFCRPDGAEVKGNTRGTCVIVYDPNHLHNTVLRWADRDQLIKEFK